MSKFNIIAQTAENTVITEYEVKKTFDENKEFIPVNNL